MRKKKLKLSMTTFLRFRPHSEMKHWPGLTLKAGSVATVKRKLCRGHHNF